MASIMIRNLDDRLKARLRVRAAFVDESAGTVCLGEAIRQRFAPLGGVEVQTTDREPLRDPPIFE